MGGGTGMLNGEVPVNVALEEKAVVIDICGKNTKISAIEGMVEGVLGTMNSLQIKLDPERTTYRIGMIRFDGTSPVRMGDRIRAGLIVSPEFGKKAVYLGLLKDASPEGRFERIDFMAGYEPLQVDWKKMGLPYY